MSLKRRLVRLEQTAAVVAAEPYAHDIFGDIERYEAALLYRDENGHWPPTMTASEAE